MADEFKSPRPDIGEGRALLDALKGRRLGADGQDGLWKNADK